MYRLSAPLAIEGVLHVREASHHILLVNPKKRPFSLAAGSVSG
jgi:hypothetical protein